VGIPQTLEAHMTYGRDLYFWRTTVRSLRWLALVLLLGSCSPVAAVLLPIINPSFETLSRPLAVGEITNGSGGAGVPVGTRPDFSASPQFVDTVEVPGWRTALPANSSIVHSGVMNPPFDGGGMPFLTGYSGTYVVSARIANMQQTLPVLIQPDTRYRLTFLSGIGLWEPGGGVFASLLGTPDLTTLAFLGTPNVTVLANSAYVPPQGSAGQMLPYALEYTTPAVLPSNVEGRYIAISFIGSDGIPLMSFDDFALDATPLSVSVCDFDIDEACDIADLNSMLSVGPIATGVPASGNEQFDITNDGTIDLADRDEWLRLAATANGLASPYKLGDANLDGTVDGQDFLAWNANKFAATLRWDKGEFNGDGFADGQDFLAWNANKFTSADVLSVPEPGGWTATLLGISCLLIRQRRRW